MWNGWQAVRIISGDIKDLYINEVWKVAKGDERAAIKVVKTKRYFKTEVTHLKRLKHPNIIEMLDCSDWGEHIVSKKLKHEKLKEWGYIVLEYKKLSLHQYIQEHLVQQMQPELLISYAYQLLQAVQCCHAHNIVHMDVKPANILIDLEGGLVLADFDHSVKVGKRTTDAYQVTRWYRPPELLKIDLFEPIEFVFETSIDLWSTGCVIAEMQLGDAIFRGKSSEQVLKLISEKVPKLPLKGVVKQLAKSLLRIEPTERESASNLIKWACFDGCRHY